MNEPRGTRAPVDSSVPSPARIWDYYIGGKDNFAIDRAVAEQVIAVLPSAPLVARLTRRFLAQVVHYLATEHGIRQFLDIGPGLVSGPEWLVMTSADDSDNPPGDVTFGYNGVGRKP